MENWCLCGLCKVIKHGLKYSAVLGAETANEIPCFSILLVRLLCSHEIWRKKSRMANICSKEQAESTAEKVCLHLLQLCFGRSSGQKTVNFTFCWFWNFWMHTLVLLATSFLWGPRAEQTSEKKDTKEVRFPKSEKMCFFINSPTFPLLFRF